MRRGVAVFSLFLATVSAEASEGLVQVSMAYCMDLREIITRDIASCISEFPVISERANKSLASWLKRNDAEFERVSKQCEGELRKVVSDSTKFDRRLQDLRKMSIESQNRELKLNGLAGCEKNLGFIESESNDLVHTYPKPAKL